jgi:hypothetical protein
VIKRAELPTFAQALLRLPHPTNATAPLACRLLQELAPKPLKGVPENLTFMDGFDARHAVGWSIFGLTVIALAGGVAINRVLVAGIETTKALQTQAAQTISTVHQRTRRWPQSDRDPMMNDGDRSRVKAANLSFRLDKVDAAKHRALYIVYYNEHPFRLNVPERM